MGVMSCCRKHCDGIMCDTYVPSVGYVCYECKEEFKKYLQQQNRDLTYFTTEKLTEKLEKFMSTPKNRYNLGDETTTVEDFFDEYTTE